MPNKQHLGKRLLSSKILLIVSLFILIFFSTNLIKEIINRRDLKGEVSSLQEEINRLESRNQDLSQLIGYFESLDFVEKEARTKLNLRKPGEQIIIVNEDNELEITNDNPVETITNFTADQIAISTNQERWWNYFFKTN